MTHPLFPVALATFVTFQVLAQSSNVSVDDFDTSANGFTFSAGWKTSTSCPGCQANPDIQQSYGGTWHVASRDPKATGDSAFAASADIAFNGSAVYVYFILPQTSTFPIGDISCSFYIDSAKTGEFTRTAPGTTGYLFDQLAFSKSLSAGQHTLSIVNDAHSGTDSVMIIDRVVYTKEVNDKATLSTTEHSTMTQQSTATSQSSNSSGLTVGAKAGIGIGAAALVVLIAILLILIRRQGFWRSKPSQTTQVNPSVVSPSSSRWSQQQQSTAPIPPSTLPPQHHQYIAPISTLPPPRALVESQLSGGSGAALGQSSFYNPYSAPSPVGMSESQPSYPTASLQTSPSAPPVGASRVLEPSGLGQLLPPSYSAPFEPVRTVEVPSSSPRISKELLKNIV